MSAVYLIALCLHLGEGSLEAVPALLLSVCKQSSRRPLSFRFVGYLDRFFCVSCVCFPMTGSKSTAFSDFRTQLTQRLADQSHLDGVPIFSI